MEIQIMETQQTRKLKMANDGAKCQSCGIPLGVGFYGTLANGEPSDEYCKFCYENGNFREPNLTLNEMIGRSIANMVDDLKMEQSEAEKLATNTIPQLKRWKQSI